MIVFAGEPAKDGHWKPDPVHRVVILLKLDLRAHVKVMMLRGTKSVLIGEWLILKDGQAAVYS